MSSKYDKILASLLSKFYTDSEVEEETRRIVTEVINAEISKIDYITPHGIIGEIKNVITEEAEQLAQKQNPK